MAPIFESSRSKAASTRAPRVQRKAAATLVGRLAVQRTIGDHLLASVVEEPDYIVVFRPLRRCRSRSEVQKPERVVSLLLPDHQPSEIPPTLSIKPTVASAANGIR